MAGEAWPDRATFQAVVTNPAQYFSDAELRSATFDLNKKTGLPLVWSGGRAIICRAVTSRGSAIAVRFSMAQDSDLEIRYKALSAHLAAHPVRTFVKTEWITDAYSIGTDHFPVLKMEWVNGRSLDEFITNMARPARPGQFTNFCRVWRDHCQSLLKSGISHGDVHAGNILAFSTQDDAIDFRMVDYDNAWLPEPTNLACKEVGHPAFVHPGAASLESGPYMDAFPNTLVYLTLLALESDPTLWSDDESGQDRLLFTRNDLADIHSKIWSSLAVSNDPLVRSLTGIVQQWITGPADKFLSLEEALNAAAGSHPSRTIDSMLRTTSGNESADSGQPQLLDFDSLAGGISADLVNPEMGIPLDRDHLDLTTYVTMLSTIVARADTPLPLSLGLFGEWGSGKSYFMGLLREQVDHLSKSGDDGYVSQIEQIGFNAWHYADTNLWASLGNEIFEQLAGPGRSGPERRARLRQELADKFERRRQLEVEAKQARDKTQELRETLALARAQRERATGLLMSTVASSDELSAQPKKVWRRLGVDDQITQGEVFANEVRGLTNDVNSLRLATSGKRGIWIAGLSTVVLLTFAFAAIAPSGLNEWFLRTGVFGMASVFALGAGLIAKVRLGAQSLTKIANDTRARMQQRIDVGLSEQLAAIQRAESQEQLIDAQLTQVLARTGELNRELADLAPGQRLYGFVAERAASGDYARELGLVSMIRRDFQQLVELMKDWQEHPEEHGDFKPIERIVLYIDDLDRCSPKQVVDVLQAVHLLLAFELFVVVVGVDPRWLLHSLSQQYRETFSPPTIHGEEVGPSGDGSEWTTTPLDYLEKIFNIPFVLPAMTKASFAKLVVAMSTTSGSPGRSVNSSSLETAQRDSDGHTSSSIESNPTPPTDQAGRAAEIPIAPGSEIAAIHSGDRPIPKPLVEAELTMLAALGPLVQSPRQAKRLLNLYRMLRSTRDLSTASDFLGINGSGEFQAVAIMLGLLTAQPRLVGDLLWSGPLDAEHLTGGICFQDSARTWQDVVRGLEPRQVGEGWVNDLACLDQRGCKEWLRIVKRAAPATALVTLPDIASFQAWGPRIARFSFVLSPLAELPEDGFRA